MSIRNVLGLIPVALLFATGCDSSAPSSPDSSLRAEGQADGPEAGVRFVPSSTREPLRFSDRASFDARVSSVEEESRRAERSVGVSESLRRFVRDEYRFTIPPASLSLADELGRVVIGDTTYTLQWARGGAVVVESVAGRAVRTVRVEQAPPSVERIKRSSEDRYGFYRIGVRSPPANPQVSGIYYLVYAHSAYTTWTGSKVANAQTEIVARATELPAGAQEVTGASEVTAGTFPNSRLSASVTTEYYGCRTYNGDGFPTSGSLYHVVSGSRGTGQGVARSSHSARLGPSEIIPTRFLSGQSDGDPC